jgi:hypothetical protein
MEGVGIGGKCAMITEEKRKEKTEMLRWCEGIETRNN